MTGRGGLVDIGKKFHYTDPIFPFNFVRLFLLVALKETD